MVSKSKDELTRPEFAIRGGGQPWQLNLRQRGQLVDAFPRLDIERELGVAALWCEANPSKRKTPSGMMKFLLGWMSRAQPSAEASVRLTENQADAMPAKDAVLRIGVKRAAEELGRPDITDAAKLIALVEGDPMALAKLEAAS